MNIKSAALTQSQYFRQVFPKRNIVLHHTVSSTAQSAIQWWKATPERIGTSYIIDKNGVIHCLFHPKFWAHHLGLKDGRNIELNRRSIGIELVNEGPLMRNEKGVFWWNLGIGSRPARFEGEHVARSWRGYEFWAAYTPQQYEALNELLITLIDLFALKPSLFYSYDFRPEAPDMATIYSHCNVRKDKTDISPAFDFSKIKLPLAKP
ncbi:MAG: hypothetical protein EPGJADBJ_04464 [Saprospiraceae bacterium]|nr:hypothetical protein [Saprospiraceae bacterium]